MGHGSREWENPDMPLSDQERQQSPSESGVLPSGEAGYFDVAQHHANRPFSRISPADTDTDFGFFGIDRPYPYVDDDIQYGAEAGSGWVLQTYPTDDDISPKDGTGFATPVGLNVPLSDLTSTVPSGLGNRIRNYQRPQQFRSSFNEPEYSFRVMDSYLHYKIYERNSPAIEIQFLSSYKSAIDWNYGGAGSYYNWGGS
jgi:hypothetical protein